MISKNNTLLWTLFLIEDNKAYRRIKIAIHLFRDRTVNRNWSHIRLGIGWLFMATTREMCSVVIFVWSSEIKHFMFFTFGKSR